MMCGGMEEDECTDNGMNRYREYRMIGGINECVSEVFV